MGTQDFNLEKLHGFFFEDLKIGMWDLFSKTISQADIVLYSGLSGDTNPIHLDKNFAQKTIFQSQVVHGMLTASLISTVIGTKMPGPGCIYVNQSLQFKAPVRIGDTVTAIAEIKKLIPSKNYIQLSTNCSVHDKVVLDGEATVLVPSKAIKKY